MFQLQLFFLLHCDEWDRVVALPRHKFVTGATLLQLTITLTLTLMRMISYETPSVLRIYTGKSGKRLGSDRGKKTST